MHSQFLPPPSANALAFSFSQSIANWTEDLSAIRGRPFSWACAAVSVSGLIVPFDIAVTRFFLSLDRKGQLFVFRCTPPLELPVSTSRRLLPVLRNWILLAPLPL